MTSASDTTITCTAPALEMGYYAVGVVNNEWGLGVAVDGTTGAPYLPVVTLLSGVTSISPTSGENGFLGLEL